ncbi:hypothetical protein [Frigoribacterium sp. UYMn621]|uniref:hypothetical protein n=1 Tax=Frigoribacterium sp. UYMn621 TaxID=3156343 RepID=UPI003396F2B4
MAEYLGTTTDAVDQEIAAGGALYLRTSDGTALMQAAQFSDADSGLVPRLSELTFRMDPAGEDPEGVILWALTQQKAFHGGRPIEVLRSSDAAAIAQLLAADRIGAFVG